MTPNLDAVDARLLRTQELIEQLKKEFQDFREKHLDAAGPDYDPSTGRLSYSVQQKPPIPRFSVLAGEALFLMRSSLDHIVGQLLIPITPQAELEAVLERSGFPVCVTKEQLASCDWTKLPRISTEARIVIEKWQPCNRTDGQSPEDHPLAVLHALNIIDKHRMSLKQVNRTTVSGFQFGVTGNVNINYLNVRTSTISGTSNVMGEMIEGDIELHSPNSSIDVQAQDMVVELAFKEVGTKKAEPVIPLLENLLDSTRKLTEEFRKFF